MDLPNFSKIRVLVVGDIMLDRYWHGDTSRISPEAPVAVVHVRETEERPGGAGNVALNLASLGCQVNLLGAVGDDLAADTLERQLQAAHVKTQLLRVKNFPTVTKVRVLGRSQQLIRVDFEGILPAEEQLRLQKWYAENLVNQDVVIISDYGKGSCRQARELIKQAREKNILVLVDPKSDNFADYFGATVITPNRKEFEAVIGRTQSEEELAAKAEDQLEKNDLAAIVLTRGEQGMTIYERHRNPLHLPTRAREVYDVTGAGDTVIAIIAAALAAGETLEEAAILANIAAGIVVRKLGAASVSIAELRRALQRLYHAEWGILTEEELMVAVEDARQHQEKIVMTNGCFDILHPGHVAYLEEAKELGKRLIIAVNDDASVRRLKGENRPVNSCHDRMTVLAALRAVDWVVPFSEDTPERLIRAVKPDVLAKGGDYKVEEIAGSDFVLSRGGEVKIIPFRTGFSTSHLIKKIRTHEERK